MKYNHTPGPWKEVEGFIVGGPWADGEIHDICDPRCAPPDDDNMAMMDANAQLISASPDLLFALERQIHATNQLCKMVNKFSEKLNLGKKVNSEDWTDRAKAAIRKAGLFADCQGSHRQKRNPTPAKKKH